MGEASPPNWARSDEELVALAQVRKGRKEQAWAAFEELYQRYRDEVYQTIYRFLVRRSLLPDHDLAQQFAHEAFMQAWEALPKKNPQSPFEGWIKLIGINKARGYIRKHQRDVPLGNDEDSAPVSNDPSSEDIEKILIDAEYRAQIERTKARLTSQEQRIFTMHYEEGREPKDIAKALGLKPGTIWQTLSRANKHFKKIWLEEAEAEDDSSQR